MALSFSRVGERDNRMVVYLSHEDQTKYRHVSNFVVKLTCEVEAGSKSGTCAMSFTTQECHLGECL